MDAFAVRRHCVHVSVPKVAQQMVAATLRTIFAQPDLASARDAVERIARLFEKRYPKLVEVLREAETDILAYFSFPVEHRRQIWSTDEIVKPLVRVYPPSGRGRPPWRRAEDGDVTSAARPASGH